MMEVFSPYVKSVLNLIKLPLGSIFYTTHPFVEKLTTENFGRKSLLLTIEQFLFKIRNYAMEWHHH